MTMYLDLSAFTSSPTSLLCLNNTKYYGSLRKITILMSLELIINGLVSLLLFLCLGCYLLKYGLLGNKMC